MTQPTVHSLYLRAGDQLVAAQTHELPDAPTSATGVVICPPWGWDEIAAHRSIRDWAGSLARAGHTTLRLDYPATGESGGYPSDAGLVEAWLRSVAAAADWVRESPGVERVAALGLGLGGLLAGVAASRLAAVEDLILWAAPTRGKTFIRSQRAFSRLQASRYTLGSDEEPQLLPEGWMETGGFVLSAETLAGLRELDLGNEGFAGVSRAFLLDQDGIAPGPGLLAHLDECGVSAASAQGPGWGDMVSHPETTMPPAEVIANVGGWLRAAEPPGLGGPQAERVEGPISVYADLTIGEGRIRESPLRIEADGTELAATLCVAADSADQPGEAAAEGLCAVFLSAGAVRRTGPNRLWLEAARRWAARGVPAVRVDLGGIGDSGGDSSRYSEVAEFYDSELTDQACAALDELAERGIGRRFIVVGLCSGGYWAFHAARRGAAISSEVLINPQVLFWDPAIDDQRAARKIGRMLQPAWIREVLRGRVSWVRIRAVAVATTTRLRASIRQRIGREDRDSENRSPAQLVAGALDDLRGSDTRIVLAFSGDEPLRSELDRDGILDRLGEWPDVTLHRLPSRDHTLRPVAAQRAAHELLDRELEAALS